MKTDDSNRKILVIGKDKYKVLFNQEQIQGKVQELAEKISQDYKNQKNPPILLFVLNGGLFFGVDLSRALQARGFNHHLNIVKLERYGPKEQGGKIKLISKPRRLFGRDVIVVEDVIDDGISMNFLNNYLKNSKRPPKSIQYCILCIKRNHQPLEFKIKYAGFYRLSPKWLVGYGMDSKQGYRGLSHLYVKKK